MSDNGTIVLDGLVLSGGGSGGGGTAATTSFEPTATINATNVQDAVEEVDAKADATKINGVAIGGKDNSCDDLGLQCKLQESATVSLKTTNVVEQRLLLKFTTADGFQDISLNPLTFSFIGSPVYGEPLYANSTNKSLRLRGYDDFRVNKPAGADWSKINVGTGPFTIKFRRKCSSAANSGWGRLLSCNNSVSPYNVLYINGFINSGGAAYTPAIPIVENAIEEILLTRLENGSFEYYKDGIKLGTSEGLNGVALDFSDWGYGFTRGEYADTEDYVSGLTLENKAYTGGNYTPSEDYPTQERVTVIKEAAVIIPVGYRQIASKTCTSTSETSLINDIGAKGTNIIPANTLQVGDVIMLDVEGQISALLGATPTINIKYGSAVLASLAKAFSVLSSSVHFHIKAMATIRSIGATGTAVLNGQVWIKSYSAESAGIAWPLGGLTEVAIDTTAENALDVTVAWSAEDAGNTITAAQVVISSLLR